MATIELVESEVYLRGETIRQLLRVLSRIEGGPAWQVTSGPDGAIVLGTHDGSPAQSNYRAWRFATRFPLYYAMYFEMWRPTSVERLSFYLDRAYLTVYRQEGPGSEQEFISLHCDPDEHDPDEQAKAVYKRGPHLHIKAADPPIPRAHIALAVGQLEHVLSDAANLTEALEWSILMIADEVLDRDRDGQPTR